MTLHTKNLLGVLCVLGGKIYKKVIVLGLGISGCAAAGFLLDKGAHVVGVDDDPRVFEGETQQQLKQRGMVCVSSGEPFTWTDSCLLVPSPGIPREHPFYQRALNMGIEIIGEAELACRFIQQPLLGVTGTNGKTTVTQLVVHAFTCWGKKARALGNIGTPLTAELGNLLEDEIVVAELSSYQLETMRTATLDAAVILNITPDHLDRYADFKEYTATKMGIASCVKPGGQLVVKDILSDNKALDAYHPRTFGRSPTANYTSDGENLVVDEKVEYILPVEYRRVFSHDMENMLAAYALCQGRGMPKAVFFQAVETFKKPPHRIQFIREIDGVKYYDDSKGTNIDAVIRAVEVMPGKVVLIVGGKDKGESYLEWGRAFGDKVSQMVAIGEAAPKISQELGHLLPITICDSLKAAVIYCTAVAKSGQCVLLSPGCSSFDMFKNYKQRGLAFQRLIEGNQDNHGFES